jgi:hypothetical protein
MRENSVRRMLIVLAVGAFFGVFVGITPGADAVTISNPVIIVGPGGTIGDYELLADTPGQWIEILVNGGDEVAGCNFNAQIADGGPAIGGTLIGPIITSVDLEGSLSDPTIFFGNNLTQNDLGGSSQLAMYSIIANIGTVAADGVLARIEIDTTGFYGDQSWALSLGATFNGPTDFAPIDADITDGSLHIPEPTSLLLLSLGGLAVIKRRRRR